MLVSLSQRFTGKVSDTSGVTHKGLICSDYAQSVINDKLFLKQLHSSDAGKNEGRLLRFALEASTISHFPNIRIVVMDNLLSLAENWGFFVESDRNGNLLVLPQQPTESWKLQQTEDRWLLIIGNVPQVKLHPDEAITFLKRRLSTQSCPLKCA